MPEKNKLLTGTSAISGFKIQISLQSKEEPHMTKTKNIKVQYSSRCSGSGYGSRYTYHPKIQMEGKWLEELGFHIGDRLQIEYEEGSIRITPVPKPLMMVAEQETSYIAPKRKSRIKA